MSNSCRSLIETEPMPEPAMPAPPPPAIVPLKILTFSLPLIRIAIGTSGVMVKPFRSRLMF